ncbi:MAG: Asp/Glu racemase [Propionibacteriales bacterium]|nr:Asp/Glu racemase [Propionibacteriales bacterium]
MVHTSRSPDADEDRSFGIIVPYDFALDREIWRWVPDDVTLLLTRTHHLRLEATVEMAQHVSTEETVRSATDDLLAVEPAVVVYLCTSGSFVNGVVGEHRIRKVMLETGAPTAVTTSGALTHALSQLEIAKVTVVTPYVESVTDRLRSYLHESGVEVMSSGGLGLVSRIWRVPYSRLFDFALETDHPESEAVFIACTNLPTYDVIAPLEAALGKPVLSANQVSLWAALQATGTPAAPTDQSLFGLL